MAAYKYPRHGRDRRRAAQDDERQDPAARAARHLTRRARSRRCPSPPPGDGVRSGSVAHPRRASRICDGPCTHTVTGGAGPRAGGVRARRRGDGVRSGSVAHPRRESRICDRPCDAHGHPASAALRRPLGVGLPASAVQASAAKPRPPSLGRPASAAQPRPPSLGRPASTARRRARPAPWPERCTRRPTPASGRGVAADGRLAALDRGRAQRRDDLVGGRLGHLDQREAVGDLDARRCRGR